MRILFLALLILANTAFAQETKYGPEYFYAIDGEVVGQAAPGVKAVYVNNKAVALNADLTFTANVSLKQGEKYLTIDTRYKNLQFIKKYLVVRHPQAQKTFKITVPQQEFKKIINKTDTSVKPTKPTVTTTTLTAIKPTTTTVTPIELATTTTLAKIIPVEEEIAPIETKPKAKNIKPKKKAKNIVKHKKKLVRPKKPPVKRSTPKKTTIKIPADLMPLKDQWLGFELVQQLAPKKYFVVRQINGKYYASVYLANTKEWIPFNSITAEAFFELLLNKTSPASFEAKNKL